MLQVARELGAGEEPMRILGKKIGRHWRILDRPAVVLLGAAFAAAVWAAGSVPTYNREIQPILQKNCIACHAPGKVAPTSFTTYESTRPWVRQIREMVAQK